MTQTTTTLEQSTERDGAVGLAGGTPESRDLTRREREVFTLLLQGMTSSAVAERLGMGRRTVDLHLCGIYDKLGARSRVHAIAEASRRGLLPVPGDRVR